MKKTVLLIPPFLLSACGTALAQQNAASPQGTLVTGDQVIDPDMFLYYIMIGLGIAFILFVIFALSRVTSVLSEQVSERYQAKLPFNKSWS